MTSVAFAGFNYYPASAYSLRSPQPSARAQLKKNKSKRDYDPASILRTPDMRPKLFPERVNDPEAQDVSSKEAVPEEICCVCGYPRKAQILLTCALSNKWICRTCASHVKAQVEYVRSQEDRHATGREILLRRKINPTFPLSDLGLTDNGARTGASASSLGELNKREIIDELNFSPEKLEALGIAQRAQELGVKQDILQEGQITRFGREQYRVRRTKSKA